MSLIPYAQLTAYKPADIIGTLQTPPAWAIWNLVDDFQNNRYPNISNFELSPDGNYLLQKSVLNWQAASPTNWSFGGDDTGSYDQQVDPATGALGLYQKAAGNATAIDAVYKVQHYVDIYGGFSVRLWRGSPVSALSAYDAAHYNLRLILNWPSGGYVAGMPILFSVFIAAGEPVTLQGSIDGVNWVVLDPGNGTDSEAILDLNGRMISLDIVPMFDVSWWNGLPQSRRGNANLGIMPSCRPPDSLQVNVNGGSGGVLKCNIDGGTFMAGSLALSGLGGGFGVWYAAREYKSFATLSAAINPNQAPFYTTPQTSMTAYVPAGTQYTVTPVLPVDTINQVSATLTVQSGGNVVNALTGNAYATVALNMLHVYFPPSFNGPLGGGPEWQVNFFSGYSLTDGNTKRISRFASDETFTQSDFCRRDTLDVTLTNEDGLFVPGSLPMANRIVTWAIGVTETESGQYTVENPAFVGQISTDPNRPGFSWALENQIYSVDLKFSDLLNDNKCCGYFPPFDGQNMYFVMRQIGYLWGFTDNRMLFPLRTIDDDTPDEYRLDAGSSYAPKWQPALDEKLIDFALRVREVCGARDPGGAVDVNGNPIIVPMVLFVDSEANLRFEPWAIGWANNFNTLLSPQPTPAKTYTIGEQFINGVPQQCQLLSLRTKVDLSNVRTNIQLVGRNPITGDFVTAGAVNNLLDGSSASNPNAAGYLGTEIDLFLIDGEYTSQETVDQTLAVMEQQVSSPVISADIGAIGPQPGLHALTGLAGYPFIGVDNFGVTGAVGPVPFWVDRVRREGWLEPGPNKTFTGKIDTYISARGVGQAGG